MSRFGLNLQMLSSCGSTWLRASPGLAPMATIKAVPLRHSVRHVSTTRPKKAQAMKDAPRDIATVAPTAKASKASTTTKTKKSSTKATAAAVAAEKEVKTATRAKKTEATKAKAAKAKATPGTAAEAKPPAAAKTTAAAKPNSAPAPAPKASTNPAVRPIPKVDAPEPIVSSSSTNKRQSAAAEPGRFAQPQQHSAPKQGRADFPASSRPSPAPSPSSRPIQTRAPGNLKPRVGASSPEYKQAAWKWTSAIVAMPILLVTSYFLFDRLALGNEPGLEQLREKIRGVNTSGEATAAVSRDNV